MKKLSVYILLLLLLASCSSDKEDIDLGDLASQKQEQLEEKSEEVLAIMDRTKQEISQIEGRVKEDPSNNQYQKDLQKARQDLLEKEQELQAIKKTLEEVKNSSKKPDYTLEIEATGNLDIDFVSITANGKSLELNSVTWDCVVLSTSDFKTLSISARNRIRANYSTWSCSNAESKPCVTKIGNIHVGIRIDKERDERSITGYAYITDLNMNITMTTGTNPELCKKLK